jgi:hypothetical protein
MREAIEKEEAPQESFREKYPENRFEVRPGD